MTSHLSACPIYRAVSRNPACLPSLFLIAALLGGTAQAANEVNRAAADAIFSDTVIPKLRIQVSRTGMEQLRQQRRVYVPATVREGTNVYTNVCIRLKGGPGSFRPLDDKPAFTLNFGRLADGQKFHGLKKLHLNNSVQDRTFLAEKLSRELFAAAEVPVPRAGHATVELNGENLGFYVLIEGIDKHFLGRHFSNTSGNLYDGHSQDDVTRRMATNSGENRNNHAALRALAAAAQEPDLTQRAARLEKALDVDRFISFLATEVIICHWDGYAMNRNNYRIYHDPDKDRMVFIPQGADQVFQRPNTPVVPQVKGLVARSVLEVPELAERYHARMIQLLTNVYQFSTITNHLYEVAAQMQPVLAEVDPDAGANCLRQTAGLCRRVQQRVRALQRELLASTSEIKFDSTGVLLLRQWEPLTDLGSPELEQVAGDEPGSSCLHIRLKDDGAASWRSRVLLDPGSYRFQGRMRLQGVAFNQQDPKAGVGLRLSRQKFKQPLSGDTPWTTVTASFQVQQRQTEVELVCELRGSKGDAWFDRGSLQLIRLE